jgi:hypothetical protein
MDDIHEYRAWNWTVAWAVRQMDVGFRVGETFNGKFRLKSCLDEKTTQVYNPTRS